MGRGLKKAKIQQFSISQKGTLSQPAKNSNSQIGTCEHDLVCRRSVEKAYFINEPAFLRHLVRKYKPQPPLSNRCYWLRIKAIEHVVKEFISAPLHGASRAVVNLGCGYDPLPFRMRWLYPTECSEVTFIDVDSSEVIDKKLAQLSTCNLETLCADGKYHAIGCDLRDLDALKRKLTDILMAGPYHTLFIADDSLKYLETTTCNELLHWLSTYSLGRLCLLERILPEGVDHPYSKPVVRCLDGRGSALASMLEFPTKERQIARVMGAGWKGVKIRDLWNHWQDERHWQSIERSVPSSRESFDEWEDFALFASHHILITAVAGGETASVPVNEKPQQIFECPFALTLKIGGLSARRFGVSFTLGSDDVVVHHGGLTQGSGPHQEVYGFSSKACPVPALAQNIAYHSAIRLQDATVFVMGGRHSESRALHQCWLLNDQFWSQVHDLPVGSYRHAAASVRHEAEVGVLCFGGQTADGEVLDHCCLWNARTGWQSLLRRSPWPNPRSGAAMISTANAQGLLIGGMDQNGMICKDIWFWGLQSFDNAVVEFENITTKFTPSPHTFRFGAKLISASEDILLIGGISNLGLIPQDHIVEIIKTDYVSKPVQVIQPEGQPPPLLGISSTSLQLGGVVISGGGVTCFPFGHCSNNGLYILSRSGLGHSGLCFKINGDDPPASLLLSSRAEPKLVNSDWGKGKLPDRDIQVLPTIPRVQMSQNLSLDHWVKSAQPVVLTGADVGPCEHLWTNTYLEEKLVSRSLIVHKSTNRNLCFGTKNFAYQIMSSKDFLWAASQGEHVYLRSVSNSLPSKNPAMLQDDFPELSDDFVMPEPLARSITKETVHSSVLRISGDINMWLHYDVMSNILCQVRGSKRVVMFPPGDVNLLDFGPGETTSTLRIFGESSNVSVCVPEGSAPVETVLRAGEILYIPSCWPHTTTGDLEAPSDFSENLKYPSIAVNVFFRSLNQDLYAAGRDVYGNRDLTAYENGRRDLAKLIALSNYASIASETKGSRQNQEIHQTVIDFGQSLLTKTLFTHPNNQMTKVANRIQRNLHDLPADIYDFYAKRLIGELEMAAKACIEP